MRSKFGPGMPGTPACAGTAGSEANATAVARRSRPIEVFVLMARMSSLLDAAGFGYRVDRGAYGDLGHHAAEVLGVVRKVVELRRVQIERLTRGVASRIENHVDGLTA